MLKRLLLYSRLIGPAVGVLAGNRSVTHFTHSEQQLLPVRYGVVDRSRDVSEASAGRTYYLSPANHRLPGSLPSFT